MALEVVAVPNVVLCCFIVQGLPIKKWIEPTLAIEYSTSFNLSLHFDGSLGSFVGSGSLATMVAGSSSKHQPPVLETPMNCPASPRPCGTSQVSHQMKYIDTSFQLFHELVKRTDMLVAGDVRRGRCPQSASWAPKPKSEQRMQMDAGHGGAWWRPGWTVEPTDG